MRHHPGYMHTLFSSVRVTAQALTEQVKIFYSSGVPLIKLRGYYPRWWLFVFFIPLILSMTNGVKAGEAPLNLVAYRTLFVISDPLRLPSDVAVDREGKIYILDGTANCVRVYDRNGKPLFTLGDQETLKLPLGLDVSPEGDVLIADSGNHRIVLFPAKAADPIIFDLPTLPGEKPADPTDVVFGQQLESFVVVDNDNHRAIALDMKGETLWSSGRMGRNPEEFRFPFMLDIDDNDNVYIVEVVNTRLQVLTKDGTHTRFIGDWGIEAGQFFRPKGVAIGESGELLVSDSYLGVIQIFSHAGDFLGAVGDEAGNLRKFTTPMGMTISGDRLFVIEMYTSRLVVLEREGT
jgi:NHL repeat